MLILLVQVCLKETIVTPAIFFLNSSSFFSFLNSAYSLTFMEGILVLLSITSTLLLSKKVSCVEASNGHGKHSHENAFKHGGTDKSYATLNCCFQLYKYCSCA